MSKNKYGARKRIINGEAFDSIKEAKRYQELLLLEKAGHIRNLERQPAFGLIPAQYEFFARYGKSGKRLKDGKKCIENSVKYIADFSYIKDDELIVEDTKGFRTKDYIIKRKLMLWIYGIKIREV
jgi:hypothetical protein